VAKIPCKKGGHAMIGKAMNPEEKMISDWEWWG
jgi:hypothetical protein